MNSCSGLKSKIFLKRFHGNSNLPTAFTLVPEIQINYLAVEGVEVNICNSVFKKNQSISLCVELGKYEIFKVEDTSYCLNLV